MEHYNKNQSSLVCVFKPLSVVGLLLARLYNFLLLLLLLVIWVTVYCLITSTGLCSSPPFCCLSMFRNKIFMVWTSSSLQVMGCGMSSQIRQVQLWNPFFWHKSVVELTKLVIVHEIYQSFITRLDITWNLFYQPLMGDWKLLEHLWHWNACSYFA